MNRNLKARIINVAIAFTSLIAIAGCATAQEETTDQQMMPMQGQMQQMREQMMSQMRDCMGMRMSENGDMQGMQRGPMGSMSDEEKQSMRQQMMGRMQNCMQQMQADSGMGGMMPMGEDETSDSPEE